MRPVALTIAGSDPTGAAGVIADVRSFHQAGVDARVVVSVVTVQGPRGLTRVVPLDAGLVDEQLAEVLALGRPGAVKTGALGNEAIVRVVARRLAKEGLAPVVDPVLRSTSGHALLDAAGERALREELVPIARLVTPNAPEAEALSGIPVRDRESAAAAGEAILALGARAVLVKGGHLPGNRAVDVLVRPDEVDYWEAPRIARDDIRGTGCTLSAAIAGLLARDLPFESCIEIAKQWLTTAIEAAEPHEGAKGPVDHFVPFPLRARR